MERRAVGSPDLRLSRDSREDAAGAPAYFKSHSGISLIVSTSSGRKQVLAGAPDKQVLRCRTCMVPCEQLDTR